jgi:hypothetical protein
MMAARFWGSVGPAHLSSGQWPHNQADAEQGRAVDQGAQVHAGKPEARAAVAGAARSPEEREGGCQPETACATT